MENLLTVKEVAAILKMSPQTIYDWVYSKKINYVKIFSEIRFYEKDIKDIMNNNYANNTLKNSISVPKFKPQIIKKNKERVRFWETPKEKRQS